MISLDVIIIDECGLSQDPYRERDNRFTAVETMGELLLKNTALQQ